MPRKRKPKHQPINNLVIIADTHCGCRMGLCPPDGVDLDDSGHYSPSKLQLKVWEWWQEFWDEWVPMVCHNEPFAVVMNGDALDGVHHGATTQISQNHADQHKLALKVLLPVVSQCDGRYYHLRGTAAHGGQSGENEETLAKVLGAIPDGEGRFARWELWARIGTGLANIMHTIGTASSMAYETTAVQKELEQAYVEAARWGHEPPNVVVRAHRHRMVETRVRTSKGYAISCTVGAWQLKTPFVRKVAGARLTEPQIGGMVIRCGDNDFYTRHWIKDIQRTPPEVLEL